MKFKWTKDLILTIVRNALGAVGAILIARFAGLEGFVEEVIGIAMMITAGIWSFWEKEGTILEKAEGLWRYVVAFAMAFITQFGEDPEAIGGILGQLDSIVTIVIPLIFSLFSKNRRALARAATGYEPEVIARTFNG